MRRKVSSSENEPLSKMRRNSAPSGDVSFAWMECGLPAGKYHRSPSDCRMLEYNLREAKIDGRHHQAIFLLQESQLAHSLNRSDTLSLAIPPPDDIKDDMVVPNDTPNPFTFEFSKVSPVKKPGGTVKIVDTRTFKVSQKISAAEVELDVGGLRYLFSLAFGYHTFSLALLTVRELHVGKLSKLLGMTVINLVSCLVASHSTRVDVLYVRCYMLSCTFADICPLVLAKPGLLSSLLKAMLPLTTFMCVHFRETSMTNEISPAWRHRLYTTIIR